MFHPLSREVACLLLAGVVVAASGCSLIDPYVRAKELDTHDGTTSVGLAPSRLAQNSVLAKAVLAAEAQRTAYYGAVSERAKLRNGLPLILVPLGALALYKGIAGDAGETTRNQLVSEGLVGASLFGLGSYYTSSTREQIYLAGAKALSCSIYAMTPYYLPDDLGERLTATKFEDHFKLIAAVEASAASVRAIQGTTQNDADVQQELATVLSHANASLANGRAVLGRAATAQSEFDGAGAALRAAVENIVNEVNQQISKLEPDPAVILGLIDSLPTTAKRLAPGGNFVAGASAKGSKEGVSGNTQVDKLNGDLKALDAQTASLQFVLDMIALRVKAVPTLSTCRLQTVQIDVSPDGPVQMKPGQSAQFVLSSTGGIRSVEWVGVMNPTKVELTKTPTGDFWIVNVAYKEAVPGLTEVTFEARTQLSRKQVTIGLAEAAQAPEAALSPGAAASAVKQSQPKPPAKPKPPGNGASAPAATAQPAPEQVAPVTGAASAAPVAPADPAAPRNAEEKKQLGERLKLLQARLHVSPTGVFDPPTRAAIRQWRRDHGFPDDDALQTAVVQSILK